MTLHVHRLVGCRPAPLAHYLKALGILRLLAEQADSRVRGWWENEHFALMTKLNPKEIMDFFLQHYAPTPFVAPWNGGSGFFPKDNSTGIQNILHSTAGRFRSYRRGIEASQKLVAGLTKKPDNKTEKPEILRNANLHWRGALRAWFDSAIVLNSKNEPSFPSILGTGGNDGRLDFTNNAMQRLCELFLTDSTNGDSHPHARELLEATLFEAPSCSMVHKAAIGQFIPGDAGGANSTTNATGESMINPWDFLLMLEGSLVLQSRSARRLNCEISAHAVNPFAIFAHAAGFASPGAEKSNRGEQWLPLWRNPTGYAEVQSLFGEARMQVGKSTAERPIDAARALTRLGTARGLDTFVRYAYLERNGQANLAVPLSRIRVRESSASRLIDDLAPWLNKLQRIARSEHAPGRLVHAERRLANRVFEVLTHDPSASRWQSVLLAAAEVERIQAKGTGIDAGPIPRLRPDWIHACDDGSPEWRLALALGSASWHTPDGKRHSIRQHWLPLTRYGRFDTTDNGKRLSHHDCVVIQGRDFITDAVAILNRQLIEAAQHGSRRLPPNATRGFAAQPGDIATFIHGETDDTRLLSLSMAAMAIDWKRCQQPVSTPREDHETELDATWWALRLATLPWPLDSERDIPVDPVIIRRCATGHPAEAIQSALRRLQSHGVHLGFSAGSIESHRAPRWAASLVFPISLRAARRAARILDPSISLQGV